jgi:hypothetical protein
MIRKEGRENTKDTKGEIQKTKVENIQGPKKENK